MAKTALPLILFAFCTINANAGPIEYYEVTDVSIINNVDKTVSELNKHIPGLFSIIGSQRINILPKELYNKILYYAANEIDADYDTWYLFILSPFALNTGDAAAAVLIKWITLDKYEWYAWKDRR
jgi:hypothetical protein